MLKVMASWGEFGFALLVLLALLCMVRDRNEVGCNTWFLVAESDIFTSLVENNELLLVAL